MPAKLDDFPQGGAELRCCLRTVRTKKDEYVEHTKGTKKRMSQLLVPNPQGQICFRIQTLPDFRKVIQCNVPSGAEETH